MSRARAKRRTLAWDRYLRRYPDLCVVGSTGVRWWLRSRRRLPAGIRAARGAAS